jgi:hypothetical protein
MITPGTWHHVAASVRRGSSGRQSKIYVDGVEVASGDVAAGNLDNSTPLCFGKIDKYRFHGQLDDVWIFRRALSGDEVKKIRARLVP